MHYSWPEHKDLGQEISVYFKIVIYQLILNSREANMKFGEYLIEKGMIEKCELEDALKFQKEKSVSLSVLAVKDSLLSSKQLSAILDYQRERGGLIGEIAIELGFLNNDDVAKLLILQKEKRNMLGDILVLYGAISKAEMEDELRQFHELVGSRKTFL